MFRVRPSERSIVHPLRSPGRFFDRGRSEIGMGDDVKLTLPDGGVRKFSGPVTGFDVAAEIGSGLAKAALPSADGEMRDLATEITQIANSLL